MNTTKATRPKARYLLLLFAVFIIGTLIDVATNYLLHFAIGGLGASLAAGAGIILMYRNSHERCNLRSLIRMLRLSWPRFSSPLDALVIIIVVLLAVATLSTIAASARHPVITPDLVMYALSAALLPPLIEEFLNRGFIQSSLERLQFSPQIVIVSSALIFSLSHIPVNSDVVPLTFVAGLCFGFITMRTKSIVLPFVIHGLWNLSVVMLVVS